MRLGEKNGDVVMKNAESYGQVWNYYLLPYLGISQTSAATDAYKARIYHCPGVTENGIMQRGLNYAQNYRLGGSQGASGIGTVTAIPIASFKKPAKLISVAETNIANRGLSVVLMNGSNGAFQYITNNIYYCMTVSVMYHSQRCNVLWADGHAGSEVNSNELKSGSYYLLNQ